ncbi:MAG TPA: hypothetical protein DDZ41_10165, partial [Flavobacterium sp.]|nr:hypothetical protein [Flavobacterium sp.]
MKKIYLLTVAVLMLACGSNRTQKMLSYGNFDEAINKSIRKLASNKNSKGNQDFVYILQDAYAKANAQDIGAINVFTKEANQANFEKLYNLYCKLAERQEKVRPLLPLKLLKEQRDAYFEMNDYSDEIISSKNGLSNYLYANSIKLLESNNKADIRQAFDDLVYLDKLNPNYKDVRKKMDEAQFRGTDFVHVYTKNETNMVIPVRLQDDLL